jgi:hypothetical protein
MPRPPFKACWAARGNESVSADSSCAGSHPADLPQSTAAPGHKNGLGLDSETAEREIEKFEIMMELAADSAIVYEKWLQLVRDYRVQCCV